MHTRPCVDEIHTISHKSFVSLSVFSRDKMVVLLLKLKSGDFIEPPRATKFTTFSKFCNQTKQTTYKRGPLPQGTCCRSLSIKPFNLKCPLSPPLLETFPEPPTCLSTWGEFLPSLSGAQAWLPSWCGPTPLPACPTLSKKLQRLTVIYGRQYCLRATCITIKTNLF